MYLTTAWEKSLPMPWLWLSRWFVEVEDNERNMGNASTALVAERIPLAQLATFSKLGGRGETEQPLALTAAEPISDSWPPPFEKAILLSSKLATGILR